MFKEIMISLGYDVDKIEKIRNTDPIDGCGDRYLCIAVNKLYKLLIELGYEPKQVVKMTTERPHIFCYDLDLVSSKFEFFTKLFGDKKTAIKVTVDFPTMYSYDVKSIDAKIEDFMKLGYKKEIIIKNLKNYPETLGLSIENNVKVMIEEFRKLGFSDENILKITSKNMSIFGRDIGIIKLVVEKYEKLGYSRKDIVSMVRKHPQMFNYASGRVENRINFLVSSGIAYDDVLKIFKLNPALIGDSEVTFKNKKKFYDSIGLIDIFVRDPKNLIQGIAKSYARYMYFKKIGLDITVDENSYKELFIGEKRFNSKYKVKTSDLIRIYDVKQYMDGLEPKSLS